MPFIDGFDMIGNKGAWLTPAIVLSRLNVHTIDQNI